MNPHKRTDKPSTHQKLGFYGGAFDPPHLAHLALAQHALTHLNLDALYVVPTGHAGHKTPSKTPAMDRLTMLSLTFAGLAKVLIDDRETRRAGPSYTVDSLNELNAEHPHAQWFLIIGEDQAQSFEGWRDWQKIVSMAQVVVAARATGDQVAHSEIKWHNQGVPNAIDLAFPAMDISATRIREAIEHGRSISEWVHPKVNDYIQHHHLYRQTR